MLPLRTPPRVRARPWDSDSGPGPAGAAAGRKEAARRKPRPAPSEVADKSVPRHHSARLVSCTRPRMYAVRGSRSGSLDAGRQAGGAHTAELRSEAVEAGTAGNTGCQQRHRPLDRWVRGPEQRHSTQNKRFKTRHRSSPGAHGRALA